MKVCWCGITHPHKENLSNGIKKYPNKKYLQIQGAAERSPLFGKLINSKPKKIRQMFFFYFWKLPRMPFTSTCFEQNITQVAALNIDTLM